MRRTILLLATIAFALMVTGGVAWAAPGPPTVMSTMPPDGAMNVDRSANIKAKFSEAMKARSINTTTFYRIEGHFTYEQLNGCGAPGCLTPVPLAGTVRYNAGNRTAILDPTSPVLCTTEYTVVVEGAGDGDMVAVKDRGGTPMATDKIFYFTTGTTDSGGGPCRP